MHINQINLPKMILSLFSDKTHLVYSNTLQNASTYAYVFKNSHRITLKIMSVRIKNDIYIYSSYEQYSNGPRQFCLSPPSYDPRLVLHWKVDNFCKKKKYSYIIIYIRCQLGLSVTQDRAFSVNVKRDCQRKCTGKREKWTDVTWEWVKIWSGIREKAVFVKYFPVRETAKLKNIAGIVGKGPPLRPTLYVTFVRVYK